MSKPEQTPVPLMDKKHNCVLFKRVENKWQWEMGGTLQRTPRYGERVVVAYSSKQFANTNPIADIISITNGEKATEIVFQDADTVWQLLLPVHANDTKTITKTLRKSK